MTTPVGETALSIRPEDVTIDRDGAVQIVNPRIVEAVKASLSEAQQAARAADTNNATVCITNGYGCKPKQL
jgi:hypothetical protein